MANSYSIKFYYKKGLLTNIKKKLEEFGYVEKSTEAPHYIKVSYIKGEHGETLKGIRFKKI